MRARASEQSVVAVKAAPAKAPAAAPVLVALIVDQLGSWVFEQRRAGFSPQGGFARLLLEGTYAADLRYEHATIALCRHTITGNFS